MNEENKNFCKQDGTDLKELFTAQITNIKNLIDANDRNYNQRFENVIQATSAALAAADRAVNKAEGASEKRFDAVNEFRGTLADQQRNLMPRLEVEISLKAINEKIENIIMRLTTKEGEGVGIREMIGYMIAIIGVVIGLTRFIK